MSSRFLFALPLLALVACAGPTAAEEETADVSDELASSATYVRITGTCFQSYDMKAINTGASLGASRLVFKPGEENKQFAFCAGTDRVILRGSKTDSGEFAVDHVWMQTSGNTVPQTTEIVRALTRANGDSFERAVNKTEIRRVEFNLGTQTLSTTSSTQLSKGRAIFAGPRNAAGERSVEAVFEEMQ